MMIAPTGAHPLIRRRRGSLAGPPDKAMHQRDAHGEIRQELPPQVLS